MFDERADGGIQPRPDPRDVGTGVLRVSRRRPSKNNRGRRSGRENVGRRLARGFQSKGGAAGLPRSFASAAARCPETCRNPR